MKKFRIKKIKEAIEENFVIDFEKINSRIEAYTMSGNIWQWVINPSPLFTIYYYEEEYESDNETSFDGFISIGTTNISVNGNAIWKLKPADFRNTKEVILKMTEILAIAMKNRYKAIFRERRIDSILS